jgi:hypothetical protein
MNKANENKGGINEILWNVAKVVISLGIVICLIIFFIAYK